jgi:hypothetical protein
MKLYRIVRKSGEALSKTVFFSTYQRAEQGLLTEGLGEDDGYFIRELEVSDQEYFKVLSAEAEEDREDDDLILGNE